VIIFPILCGKFFESTGREIASFQRHHEPGLSMIDFDFQFAPGVYQILSEVNGNVSTKKFVVF